MTKDDLKQEILKLLKTSTIPQHDKNMLEILLPTMAEAEMQKIYDSLSNEQRKMAQLDEKKKRIELKYKVMTEGLTKSKEG